MEKEMRFEELKKTSKKLTQKINELAEIFQNQGETSTAYEFKETRIFVVSPKLVRMLLPNARYEINEYSIKNYFIEPKTGIRTIIVGVYEEIFEFKKRLLKENIEEKLLIDIMTATNDFETAFLNYVNLK